MGEAKNESRECKDLVGASQALRLSTRGDMYNSNDSISTFVEMDVRRLQRAKADRCTLGIMCNQY